jgi:hypothetical protein
MKTPQIHRTAAGETVLNHGAAQLVAQALTAGLRFCEGFEDDELQEGMAEILASQRQAAALLESPASADDAGQDLQEAATEVLAEIRRLNAAAGETVFNPAATQLLIAAIGQARA